MSEIGLDIALDAPAPEAPRSTGGVKEAARQALDALQAELKPVSAADHPSVTQPRTDQGTFAQRVANPGTEPTPTPQPEAAPVEDEPPVEATGDADDAVGDEPAEEPERITVEIPGRNPGETVELQVEDLATAERLRQLTNGYRRGQELAQREQALDAQMERFMEERDQVVLDPVHYLTSSLKDPGTLNAAILSLLATVPGAAEAISAELAEWADPNIRRARTAELKNEYTERQQALREHLADQRVVRQHVRAYKQIATALTPPTLVGPQRDMFVHDCLQDIKRYAAQSADGLLHPRDVPAVVKPRLRAYGLTDQQIEQAIRVLTRRDAAPAKPAVVRPTGQELVQAAARRDAVAAPPPGAGGARADVAYNPKDGIKARAQAMLTAKRQQRASA